MTSAIILGASEPPVLEKPEARLSNKGWAGEFFLGTYRAYLLWINLISKELDYSENHMILRC